MQTGNEIVPDLMPKDISSILNNNTTNTGSPTKSTSNSTMGWVDSDLEDLYNHEDDLAFLNNNEEEEEELKEDSEDGQTSSSGTMDKDNPLQTTKSTWMIRWSGEAMKLLQKGEFYKTLHYLSLCLDEEFRLSFIIQCLTEGRRLDIYPDSQDFTEGMLSDPELVLTPGDEFLLLEKRCLVLMKLRMFDKVWEDSRRILEKKPDHTLALKCLLAALCKMNKLDQVPEVLKLWKKTTPNDLDMLECRTKLEGLLLAVTNGIEPKMAFSNVEELLGLSYDWLLGRKVVTDSQWSYRPLPPGHNSFVLCLSHRFGSCPLGDKCPEAHGEQELEEWKTRYSTSNMTVLFDKIKLDSEASYVKSIMDNLVGPTDTQSFLTEELTGIVHVTCLEPLHIQIKSGSMDAYTWKFNLESKRPLHHVCLLQEMFRSHFHISSAVFNGTSNKVNLLSGKNNGSSLQVLDVQLSETTLTLTGSEAATSYSYSIEIAFKSAKVFGNFRQIVVFDFDSNPKLIRNLTAEVVPLLDEDSAGEEGKSAGDAKNELLLGSCLKSRTTWNFGNAEIVDSLSGDRVPMTKIGFALMNGNSGGTSVANPKNEAGAPTVNKDLTLTRDNYKERMRFFLTQEERARQEILSKYNISAILHLSGKYDIKGGYNDGMTHYAVDGSLYGQMTLFRDVSEDTAVGRLILRSCNYVLLTKSDDARKAEETGKKPKVYLCNINDKTKNAMYIEVGHHCVKELGLDDRTVASFDIQFQLSRTAFTQQKNVIDQINETHLNLLFPSFDKEFYIPWSTNMQWNNAVETEKFRLNPKQKEALIAVTAESCITPPILMIGPFGTGKTFTLAQCIRKILTQDNNRIIICTHSNSAADLYIKEYLNPMVQEGEEIARPLRIYYEERSLKTVHPTVLQYCLVENGVFRRPTRDEVLARKVIVVTLSTSYSLMDLDLPSDTFSHILLDEAAQAMESEAITPLMVAGERTRLVLAGDHMQLSPELFSDQAKNFHSSLLERLHYSYPDNHPCKLMLCENYRSHSSIIQFASEAFYSRKLQCGLHQPVHDKFYPLSFFVARGEDIQEADSTSYYNIAEVCEVTDRVVELVASWPEKWGNWKNENAIGVLTPYPDQVVQIRARLRQKGLYNVSVERVMNVQGKQFRAVFLSTVRTHKPWVHILPSAVGNEVDLGFFSNPKLLNTALTRAQSLVAVVGDPVSLCSLGKCRRLWEDFIKICHDNKSLFGISFSQLRQNIAGIELRVTWGLNPLANEFEPAPPKPTLKRRSKFQESVLRQLEIDEGRPGSSRDNHSSPRSRPKNPPPQTGTTGSNPPYIPKLGEGILSTPPQVFGNPPQAYSLLGVAPPMGIVPPTGIPRNPFMPPYLNPGPSIGIPPGLRQASPVGGGSLERSFSNPTLGGNPPNSAAFNMQMHQYNQLVMNPQFMQGHPILPPPGSGPLFQAPVNMYASGMPLLQMNHPPNYMVPFRGIPPPVGFQHRHPIPPPPLHQHRLPHAQASASAFTPYFPQNPQHIQQQHAALARHQLLVASKNKVKLVPRPFMTSPNAFPPLIPSTAAQKQAAQAQAMMTSASTQSQHQHLAPPPLPNLWNNSFRGSGSEPNQTITTTNHLATQSQSSSMEQQMSGAPLYRPMHQGSQQQLGNDIWVSSSTQSGQQQQQQMYGKNEVQVQTQQQQQQREAGSSSGLRLRFPLTAENFPPDHKFSAEEILFMKNILENYVPPQAEQHEQRPNTHMTNSSYQQEISGRTGQGLHNLYSTDGHQQQQFQTPQFKADPFQQQQQQQSSASAAQQALYQMSLNRPGITNFPIWSSSSGDGDAHGFDFGNPRHAAIPSSSSVGAPWNGSSTVSSSGSNANPGSSFFGEGYGLASSSGGGGAGRSYASAVKQHQQKHFQQQESIGSKGVGHGMILKPQPVLVSDARIPPLFPNGVTFNNASSNLTFGAVAAAAPLVKKSKKKGKKE